MSGTGVCRRLAVALLVLLLAAAPAAADRVLLTNGESFDGVVAEPGAAGVTIRLEIGEIRLPAAQVERIERRPAPLATFLARHERLEASGEATPGDWLELAAWALAAGLRHAAREPALRAAEADPGLAGLERLMPRLGYALEGRPPRWVPWTPSRPIAAEVPPPRPQRRLRPGRRDPVAEHLARAVELLARAEVERRPAPEPPPPERAPRPTVYAPLVVWSGWVLPEATGGESDPAGSRPASDLARQLLWRQPGSLLPIGGR